MPGEQPKPQQLSKLEKAAVVKEQTNNYERERDSMYKKYDEIRDLTQDSAKLSTELDLNPEEVKQYAEKSPDFKDKMQQFNNNAYTGFTTFRDFYADYLGDMSVMKYKADVKIFTDGLKINLGRKRAKTHKKFTEIKGKMKASVKEMIRQEKVRAKTIKDFQQLPELAVQDLPKDQRAAAMQKLQLNLKYQDTLALLKTAPVKELAKKFDNEDVRFKLLQTLKEQIGAEQSPQVERFAKLRLQREQLKAQVKALDPKFDFVLKDDFPKKYSPSINDKSQNEYTLDMPITDSYGLTNSEPALKSASDSLANQIDALNIIIQSKKADKMLSEIHTQEDGISETWGSDNVTFITENYIKYPKSIQNARRGENQSYFSAAVSGQILKDGPAVLQRLTKAVKDAKTFIKLANIVKKFQSKAIKEEDYDQYEKGLPKTPFENIKDINTPSDMKIALSSMEKLLMWESTFDRA